MAWIEFHLALRDHWKIQRLAAQLGIEYAQALGHVSCLWCWAGDHAQNGELERFTDAEICDAARYKTQKKDEKAFLEALKNAELINENKSIHDWTKHGIRILKSSRKRMKKYRNSDVTVTSPKRNSSPNLSYLSTLSIPSTLSLPCSEKQVAERLGVWILKNNPKARLPKNLNEWELEVKRAIEIDKRSFEEIGKVMDWCQQDQFWKSNILSMSKLREKFDQLTLKMQEVKNGSGKNSGTITGAVADPNKYDKLG